MLRNRRKFTALWASALIMGLAIGIAPGVTQVFAKTPPPAVEEPQLEAKPGQGKPADEKSKPAPTRCKVSKDCQKGNVCQKVGDHKECVAPAAPVPETPVMT